MHAALSLLAAFLAVVVVGVSLTAVHDALERGWQAARAPAARRPRRGARPARLGPAVAWRHLH